MRSRLRSRSLSLWLVLASAALVAGGPPAAQAQSEAPSAPSALAEQARSARAQGRYAEAIDAYGRAYLDGGDPNVLFELGECQRAAGRDADATRSFQNYLRRAPRGPHHRRAEEHLKDLQSAASQAPSTATATATPLRVTPAPPALPPQAATPTPRAEPAAIPPAPAAAAPNATSSPPAVDLRAAAAPAAAPPLHRWVPWSLAATTVVLAGVAVWSGLSANDRFDQLQHSCGQTSQGCDAAATGDLKDRARRTNILWALTGVAALGTGVTIYLNTSAAGVSGLWRY